MRSSWIPGLVLLTCFCQAQVPGSNINEWTEGFEKRKAAAIDSLDVYQAKDTARINRLIKLINTAYFHKQRRDLIAYWEECLQLSKQLNYPKGLASAYLWKAYYYRGDKNLDGFHHYMDSSIKASQSFPDLRSNWANAHRMKGLQYQEQENYHAALKHYFESLRYYDTVQDIQIMYLLQNISSSYLQLNNQDQAALYAEKGALLADTRPMPKILQLQAYATLASVLLKQEKSDQAYPYLQRVAPFMPDTLEQALSSNHFLDMGHYFFKKQQFDSSFHYYEKGYQIASSGNHKINTYGALNYLFKNSLKLGKLKESRNYVLQGLEEAKKTGKTIHLINAYANLADYEAATENPAKAYEFLKKSTALKDQFSLQNNQTTLNNLSVLYESAQKEHTIQVLEKENEVRVLALERQAFKNKVYIASIFLLALFLFLIYRYYVAKQKNQQQQVEIQRQKIIDLEKDNQLLHMTAMLRGQEEERSRIARDLHDGIGSLLSGIKMSFANIKEKLSIPTEQTVQFDRSLSMLDNSIFDLRRIAYNLMPDALLKFGLTEAVEDLCDQIQTSTNLRVRFQYTGEVRKWKDTESVYLYRIIQELVNNVIKHAKAENLMVQMTVVENWLSINVEDDGIGYELEKMEKIEGNGLNNIRYRTELLGGKCDIITGAGEGTSVTLEFELPV
ncbi:tetratricopeptide repeat-containing sensor histidine kinase [Flavihumibacter sp. UBA7668]|uniref:tetratricopeptide repeat-containing sensor histidine kinase n=1 Tax=Flavihumibacter sp. UBA7668 TaxID=1946542 RepID=UPI0025BC8C8C|nr:ATP-binding protein [Flavihumibacter sp. UBA7668]